MTETLEVQLQANDVLVQIKSLQDRIFRIAATAAAPTQCITEEHIRRVQKLRMSREVLFGSGLFADPAWDMLIDLYAAELGQHRISVSSLCLASTVPSTTALRWIKKLEHDGWVYRVHDPMDGRRSFVHLSQKGAKALRTFFAHIDRTPCT